MLLVATARCSHQLLRRLDLTRVVEYLLTPFTTEKDLWLAFITAHDVKLLESGQVTALAWLHLVNPFYVVSARTRLIHGLVSRTCRYPHIT